MNNWPVRRGEPSGVFVRDTDAFAAWDAKRDVHVACEILGPGSSEMSDIEDEDDRCVFAMYRWIPVVDGRPYSLAMASNIDPIVGCSGISLPLLHLLADSAPSVEVDAEGG